MSDSEKLDLLIEKMSKSQIDAATQIKTYIDAQRQRALMCYLHVLVGANTIMLAIFLLTIFK